MAHFADILAPVNLKFMMHPVVAADVQLPGVWAVFEHADVGTEITEYMAPMEKCWISTISQLVAAFEVYHSLPQLPVLHLARIKYHPTVRTWKSELSIFRLRGIWDRIGPALSDGRGRVDCPWTNVGLCIVDVGDGSRGETLF